MQTTSRIIGNFKAAISEFAGPIRSIAELLRVDDKPYLTNGKIKFRGLKQEIRFVDVSFGYEPAELVLKNVNLSIEVGKTTALVGSSGSGKSTLIDLIPRFYDPNFGSIFVDEIEINKLDLASLRSRIAIVSQDSFIFHTSVRNNIADGLNNIDESKIIDAAKSANAIEFIEDMPEGFDTVLGDRGIKLSGGQKQRLAIARAILRNAEILILDEATSALDSVSEKLIQKSLAELSQGRTVVTIAHRLSTIANADRVVVLEKGRVVESGDYQALLAERGKLWNYHRPYEQKIYIDVKSFNEEIYNIQPTFLIIDIEGGEYDIFKYADLSNLKKICLELHNDVLGTEKTNFVLSKLASWGFLIDDKASFTKELF